MKVLLVHNFYRSGAPGGEDEVFRQERLLLERAGIAVVTYERSNDEIDEGNTREVFTTATRMSWSQPVYNKLRRLVARERPDVAHFHNTFPLITLSAFAACKDFGVPTVQTLHNYRLICSNGTFFRDGKVCEICSAGAHWAAVRHRCYRDSVAGSAAVAWMLRKHWRDGSFLELIDRFVVLSAFAASQFIAKGVPAERLVVKPNFVDSPGPPDAGGGGYVVFVSRLAEEKGVRTLLRAWRELRDIPLKVVGDGPMMGEMRQAAIADGLPVEFLGMRPRPEVLSIIGRAEIQVIASEWFEGFPLVIVEAYARGTPIVASRIGSLQEIVLPERTGSLFEPGNAAMLATHVRRIWADPLLRARLRVGARQRFEEYFSPAQNLERLLAIYGDVMRRPLSSVAFKPQPARARGLKAPRIWPRKILLVHNFYRSGTPGGEDNAFNQERELLQAAGLEVVTFTRFNDDVDEHDPRAVVQMASQMRWSGESYRELKLLAMRERPDVAHFHNTFPLISASVYAACRELNLPIVQTLHNYRLVCCAGTFFRAGAPCQRCTSASPWAGVRHRCYRGSLAGSAAVALMLRSNWRRGVYTELIDVYVALTQFAAELFAAEGVPTERIVVNPNFVDSPAPASPGGGGFVVFAARLSEEKGISTLLKAWRELRDVPLKVAGDGPLLAEFRAAARAEALPIEFLGMLPRAEVLELIGAAELQLVASECYEGFPLVVAESYARGTPVVASRIGGLIEIIRPDETGLHFEVGNAASLAAQVRRLWADPLLRERLRLGARRRYEAEYTPQRSLERLLAIYERARGVAAARAPPAGDAA